MNKYQAIIFDVGNVIVNISGDNAFEYWAMVSNHDADVIKQRFEIDNIYHQFEKGKLEPAIYRKYILKKIGLQMSDDEFDNGWNNIYTDVVPGIEQLLQDLKSGFRLTALTNTNVIHAKEWRTKYASVLQYFDKVFCSHEIKTRKPERKAYEIVLTYLQMEPHVVVYLDDIPEYVKAATDMGIKSILVTSSEQMVEELNTLGITVNYKQ
jgi:epoxide hydrolase-like predicted phosphatase